MDNPSRFMCPICGCPDLRRAPRTTSGAGSHEICPCCGFQFGYDDDDQGFTYDGWRRRWVAKLMPWFSRARRPPPGWNPVEQLRQVVLMHGDRTREEWEAQPAPAGERDGAQISPAASAEEEEEKLPREERDADEERTYFNPDTGKTTIAPPGVTLGPPWLRVPNIFGPTYLQAPATQTWINPNSLEQHYIDHADKFGARDEEDYAAKANEFFLESVSRGYQMKADSTGVEYIYDPKTNTFGMYTADGRTITFFKPDTRDYWDRQPGFVVKKRAGLRLPKTEGGAMDNPSRFMCPICGYPDLECAPRRASGAGSHEICACCGFQFGYHDDDQGITYDEWRRRWVAKLMPWKARTVRPPPGWNPVEQLRQVVLMHGDRTREEFKARDK